MTAVDIKTGSHIRVPKGTTVYSTETESYWKFNKDTAIGKPSTRDMVVKCNGVRDAYHHTGKLVNQGKVVCWGQDKFTLLENVEVADEPVRKEAVSKGPTLRQRMVKGTKWKLSQDAKLVKNGKEYGEVIDDGVIPAGTIIEIMDKFTTYGPGWYNGLWVPIKFPGWESRLVEFSQINQNPEQVGEAEVVPIFVIWDKAQQKYYGGYNGRMVNGCWQYSLDYADKLTKAKKFNRLADVRVHALVQTGYYDDLPHSWGDVPDWMQGSKAFDIPDTWEIVKIDKLTKNEIERIELVDTFKRSWRLRELTVKYGSAVRQVYSDLEKKGKLTDYQAMMYFTKKHDDSSYWYDYELTESEKAEVMELIDRYDKNDMKTHKSTTGYAVAVTDDSMAAMAKLMYSGNLACVVIDFKTMSEIVNV